MTGVPSAVAPTFGFSSAFPEGAVSGLLLSPEDFASGFEVVTFGGAVFMSTLPLKCAPSMISSVGVLMFPVK